MATELEVITGRAVHREELMRAPKCLEHVELSPSGGLARDLTAVVQVSNLPKPVTVFVVKNGL